MRAVVGLLAQGDFVAEEIIHHGDQQEFFLGLVGQSFGDRHAKPPFANVLFGHASQTLRLVLGRLDQGRGVGIE